MPALVAAVRSTWCTTLVVGWLAAASSGCGRPPAPETGAAPDRDAPVSLTISNNNWLDATILVEHDGQVTRVGTVTAASSEAFSLPSWMLGPERNVRLIAHPIGSNQMIDTDLLHVQPGQFIEWHLESQLAMSSVGVY